MNSTSHVSNCHTHVPWYFVELFSACWHFYPPWKTRNLSKMQQICRNARDKCPWVTSWYPPVEVQGPRLYIFDDTPHNTIAQEMTSGHHQCQQTYTIVNGITRVSLWKLEISKEKKVSLCCRPGSWSTALVSHLPVENRTKSMGSGCHNDNIENSGVKRMLEMEVREWLAPHVLRGCTEYVFQRAYKLSCLIFIHL